MAENRRIEIEAEMKAEMDRLKTKFQFKQQELETARLRFAMGGGPPSTLQRTRYAAPQSTQPTPGPSRLQNHRNGNMSIPMTDVSPSRRRIATPLSARSPEAINGKIEPIAFPGFHDSFAPRGPGASKVNASISPRTSPRKGKGKGKAIEKTNKDISRPPQSPILLSQHQQHSPGATRDTDRNPFDELPVEEHHVQDGGVTGSSLDVLPLDEGRDCLHRVIFTHCAPPIGKEAPQLTMQLLLSTTIPSPLQDTSRDINGVGHGYGQYIRACGNLLNLFGHTSGLTLKTTIPSAGDLAEDSTYQALVKVVGESVLQVANILHIHKLDAPLYGLLDLIKFLVLLFPSFRSFFLVTISQPGSSTLTTLLCNCMRSFHPSSDLPASPSSHRTKSLDVLLADAIGSIGLDIMEALTWNIPDVQAHLLETISSDSSMFMNLLSPSQPPWLIQRSVYLLLCLSLRPQLLASFIGSNSGSNLVVLPYARHLTRSIVGFFANLCILHDKTSIILETYSNLVPSLVLCLTDAADRFWEEDEDFANGSTEDHDALIKVLVPALCLIHHLFYGMEVNSQPSLSADLPHILQQAASLPAYNGLDHTFIVTMTRLGYADVPEWLGAERVMLIDDVAEVAREMLELFVGGPEADLIVSAYVPDDEDKIHPDEETQDEEPSNDAEIMDTDDS
ncbi:hypothetical protein BS47DRAFT_1335108 [Hydnum rufescens UP504]|uniref:Uncharacterized protein n=1 Tax=Hydnum rufescens UP504 TaxID=1448309 RepID=A0A9P6BB90_9AGAM|nr:hypothetical protein BS47DRAFT_1335108 [Hydnum rufescens UP504]